MGSSRGRRRRWTRLAAPATSWWSRAQYEIISKAFQKILDGIFKNRCHHTKDLGSKCSKSKRATLRVYSTMLFQYGDGVHLCGKQQVDNFTIYRYTGYAMLASSSNPQNGVSSQKEDQGPPNPSYDVYCFEPCDINVAINGHDLGISAT